MFVFLFTLFLLLLLLLILVLFYFFHQNILSYLNIHNLFYKMPQSLPQKMVVFDLDETLGCFIELGIFWDALENYYKDTLSVDKFNELLDIFPEFFRPNIFKILDFVHRKKTVNKCNKIIIYTNNQGPTSWAQMISEYFNHKLGYKKIGCKLFDLIIPAYMVGGKIVEPNRTTHDKCFDDLLRCTKMPKTTEVCFVDDLYHPLMKTSNVSYINIKPYHFAMPFADMATRYYDKVVAKSSSSSSMPDKNDFIADIVKFMKRYNYIIPHKGEEEKKDDKQMSKSLLSHLEDFLKKGSIKNTRKQRMIKLKKTRTNRKML